MRIWEKNTKPQKKAFSDADFNYRQALAELEAIERKMAKRYIKTSATNNDHEIYVGEDPGTSNKISTWERRL